MTLKVQFLLKKREVYSEEYSSLLQSGLWNSANFIATKLKQEGYVVDLVDIIDNNCIDREVTKFKPDIVIIEALFVVPDKFQILHQLHPNVTWIVRLHSKLPFLAQEGIAIDWIKQYKPEHNVYVAANALDVCKDLEEHNIKCLYLPNYYPLEHEVPLKLFDEHKNDVHIGCFGAQRALKNILNQAIAAIKFAKKINKNLYFHINGSRVESGGDSVIKNVRALFKDNGQFKLVEHDWLPHNEFLDIVRTMDYGMQVSFSESFCIIAADFISQGIPVITSDEIVFNSSLFHADCNNTNHIADKLYAIDTDWYKFLYGFRESPSKKLMKSNEKCVKQWNEVLKELS